MSSIFQKTPANLPYLNPTPGEITLVAGTPNFDAAMLTPALCSEVAACGFNTISAPVSQSAINQSLTNCSNANLKLILSNNTIFKPQYTDAYINSFKTHKALGGWFLTQNISEEELEKNSDVYNVYHRVTELDDKHLIFISLNGDWKKDNNDNDITNVNGIAGYPSYLAKFQDNFNPGFWPIIYFPDVVKPEMTSLERNNRVISFYKDLQYFSYVARYTATPFWIYCRCQAFTSHKGYVAPSPTERSMKLVVFSALAHGAQGIYYWDYHQTYGSNYFNAPVDANGNKTATWDMVRAVNEEVKIYNDVFQGCEFLECRHKMQFNANTDFIKMMTGPMGPLLKIEKVKTDINVMVSQIFNKGKNYLVIVANPFLITNLNTIRLVFSEYYKVYRLSIKNKAYTEELITNYSDLYNMSSLGYIIFRWE